MDLPADPACALVRAAAREIRDPSGGTPALAGCGEDAWGAAVRYSDMAIALSEAGVTGEADRLGRLAAAFAQEAANVELFEAVESLLRT